MSFFRVSQIDYEFLEFYGSLQLCHESKKRQYFDEWKSIDDQPPLQSSLGIEPVIPQVDKEEVRQHWKKSSAKTCNDVTGRALKFLCIGEGANVVNIFMAFLNELKTSIPN